MSTAERELLLQRIHGVQRTKAPHRVLCFLGGLPFWVPPFSCAWYLLLVKIDPAWFAVVGDLFVNLSAGWFAATLVVPINSEAPKNVRGWVLLTNIAFGIMALVVAYQLRILSSV